MVGVGCTQHVRKRMGVLAVQVVMIMDVVDNGGGCLRIKMGVWSASED